MRRLAVPVAPGQANPNPLMRSVGCFPKTVKHPQPTHNRLDMGMLNALSRFTTHVEPKLHSGRGQPRPLLACGGDSDLRSAVSARRETQACMGRGAFGP